MKKQLLSFFPILAEDTDEAGASSCRPEHKGCNCCHHSCSDLPSSPSPAPPLWGESGIPSKNPRLDFLQRHFLTFAEQGFSLLPPACLTFLQCKHKQRKKAVPYPISWDQNTVLLSHQLRCLSAGCAKSMWLACPIYYINLQVLKFEVKPGIPGFCHSPLTESL